MKRKIVANTNGILSAASEIYNLQGEVNKAITTLENYKSELPSYWKGEDATTFINKLDGCINKMKRFNRASENYCNYLKYVGETFEAIESSYNRVIDVPKGGA